MSVPASAFKAGGSTDLRYDGAYAPGSYTDGDIVIYNGIAYMAQRPTTNPPTPWPVGGLAPVTAGGMIPIADIVLSSPQASIDIPSIPQIYSHLRLVTSLRSTQAAANDQALIRFNGDAGGNYAYQFLRGGGSSATATENVSSPAFTYIGQPAGANAPANAFDTSITDIIDYASTTKHKTSISNFTTRSTDVSGGLQAAVATGFWKSLAAITQVTVYTANGQWVAGSRVTLYGVLATPTILPAVSPIVAPIPATTLPASPSDQQQAILVDNTTTPTYSWLFQWSATAAKWLFIGGAPLCLAVDTNENSGGTGTWRDLTTVGPTFTTPRAGDWEVSAEATTNINATAQNAFGISAAGSTPVTNGADSATVDHRTTGQWVTTSMIPRRKSGLAVSSVIKMMYYDGGGSSNFQQRKMTIMPVAVT